MFRIFALAIFLAGVLIGGSYRYQAEKSGEKLSWNEEGAIIMVLLRIFGLIGWLSVIVYLLNPEWMKWSELPLPDWARWIGVITGIISVPLIYWLFISIGKNITQTVKTRKEHELVTSGPYRWVRHPLYSVGTLLFLSFALMASNWFIGLATLMGLVMLMVRLPKEERNLIARFGDEYRNYMMIKTTHLELQPFSPKHLLALMASERQFEESFGRRVAEGLREMYVSDDVSPAWLAELRASESPDPWVYGFAVIQTESNSVIGSVGFKGPPDNDGVVEIAYGIAPSFQGKGYATEAAAAGVDFAFSHESVQLVRAHTLPTPNASPRVLAKCGFEYTGEVVDPEDGLVWRWELHRATLESHMTRGDALKQ